MISYKKTVAFIKQNKYIVLAAIFFLIYRTFFTWLLFHGRSVPPEPDDSYFYLATSKIFPTIGTFEDFRLFYFSAWIKFLSLFTLGDYELAYFVNFLVGPLILLWPLCFFLSKLRKSKTEIAFLIFIITFFSGSGQYHGFYWVVPSFYHYAAFLFLLGFIVSKKKESFTKISLASYLFIFSHPTGLFASLIFYMYGILTYFFNAKVFKITISNLTKLTVSVSIAFLSYFLIGKSFPADNSPESFNKAFEILKNLLNNLSDPVSLPIIWKEYISIISVNILSLILFVITIITTFIADKKLFSLFIGSLTLVLLAVYVPYGARTLAYLWPFTFLMVGAALIEVYKYFKKVNRRFVVLLPLLVFALLTTIFNFIHIKSINASKDYEWDRLCPKTTEGSTIFFKSLESKYAFSLFSNKPSNSKFLSKENLEGNVRIGNLIVLADRLKYRPESLSKIEQLLVNNVTRKERFTTLKSPDNNWTQTPIEENNLSILLSNQGLNYSQIQDCGYYKIYRINKI